MTTRDSWDLEGAERWAADKCRRGVMAAGLHLQNAITEEIRGTEKTGRIYKRRTITHQASAPGESPATDTGQLIGSLITESVEGPKMVGSQVTANAAHALMLEQGTEKMEARPFMVKTLRAKARQINQVFTAAASR